MCNKNKNRTGVAAYDQLEQYSSTVSANNDEHSKGVEIFIFAVLTIVDVIIVTAIM